MSPRGPHPQLLVLLQPLACIHSLGGVLHRPPTCTCPPALPGKSGASLRGEQNSASQPLRSSPAPPSLGQWPLVLVTARTRNLAVGPHFSNLTPGAGSGAERPPPPFQDLTAHTLAQATSLSPQPQLVLCTPYCQEAEGPRGGGSGVPSGRTCSLCPPPSPPPPALRVQLSLCEPGPPSTGHSAPCSSLHYSVPPRRVCFAVLPQPLGRWRAHSGAQLPGPFPGLFTPDTDARIRVSSPQPGPASPRPGDSNG